jgi:UDP-glucose 4-epimerase
MDLAKGHVLSLDALAKPHGQGIFTTIDTSKSGHYRAFNLGKGKGMSVLDMINAMKKASGFDYQYEIVGRRYVSHTHTMWKEKVGADNKTRRCT